MKLKLKGVPKFKIGDKVFDKTSRRKAVVEAIEDYKGVQPWYVIRYISEKYKMFVRNAHPQELRK